MKYCERKISQCILPGTVWSFYILINLKLIFSIFTHLWKTFGIFPRSGMYTPPPPPPAPTPSWLGWLKLTKACGRMVSITWFLIMCKLSTLSRLQTFLAETIPNFVLDCEEKTGRCPLLSSYCTLSN